MGDMVFLWMVIGAVVIFVFGRNIYWSFDHGSWTSDAKPDCNASVTDISSEKVKYVKNGARFKTTVMFSDGYKFVTHKTNRDQHMLSYTIYLDSDLMQMILKAAYLAHKRALKENIDSSKVTIVFAANRKIISQQEYAPGEKVVIPQMPEIVLLDGKKAQFVDWTPEVWLEARGDEVYYATFYMME